MLKKISVIGGNDKDGYPEIIHRLDIRSGEVLAVVGPTGSGKTQLISDIEQHAGGDTPSCRSILINDMPAGDTAAEVISQHPVAEVSQKMNFVINASVEDFLSMHARIRGIDSLQKIKEEVLAVTNELSGEPVCSTDNLMQLSGGQARALMVADVALISNAPVVVIDEIENAGIDRLRALEILTGHGKAVLIVTHDPTLTLMAGRRVVMKNGGMYKLHITTSEEKRIMDKLITIEKNTSLLRNHIRSGGNIDKNNGNKEGEFPWQEFFTHSAQYKPHTWKNDRGILCSIAAEIRH
jgi:ABC-type lipoprotein export system ATPase subunit